MLQKYVETNFQIRQPENLDKRLPNRGVNSDAFIKAHDAAAPAKTKCRDSVVMPIAEEEAPRPLEQPVIIS